MIIMIIIFASHSIIWNRNFTFTTLIYSAWGWRVPLLVILKMWNCFRSYLDYQIIKTYYDKILKSFCTLYYVYMFYLHISAVWSYSILYNMFMALFLMWITFGFNFHSVYFWFAVNVYLRILNEKVIKLF